MRTPTLADIEERRPSTAAPARLSQRSDRALNRAAFKLIDFLIDRIAPCPWTAHSGRAHNTRSSRSLATPTRAPRFSPLESALDAIAPAPWGAHIGASIRKKTAPQRRKALYTAEERIRRDKSAWTIVQAVLAPLQFLVFLISAVLVARYFATGEGVVLASASIVLKTGVLYAIMVTGSIWEKEVFGRWLFAEPFFWEDAVSMVVIALHTAYLLALLFAWGSTRDQMILALAAYAAYVVNAAQFVIKLRAARREGDAAQGLTHLQSPA